MVPYHKSTTTPNKKLLFSSKKNGKDKNVLRTKVVVSAPTSSAALNILQRHVIQCSFSSMFHIRKADGGAIIKESQSAETLCAWWGFGWRGRHEETTFWWWRWKLVSIRFCVNRWEINFLRTDCIRCLPEILVHMLCKVVITMTCGCRLSASDTCMMDFRISIDEGRNVTNHELSKSYSYTPAKDPYHHRWKLAHNRVLQTR